MRAALNTFSRRELLETKTLLHAAQMDLRMQLNAQESQLMFRTDNYKNDRSGTVFTISRNANHHVDDFRRRHTAGLKGEGTLLPAQEHAIPALAKELIIKCR